MKLIDWLIDSLPNMQNFTVQGWNDEIKEKINDEETWKKPRGL